MGLRILGPLALLADDHPVKIGGQRQRIVLAMLTLNANRVTSIDQLVDAVWGTAPPLTARHQIQSGVYRLRKILNRSGHPHALQTRDPGYVLNVSEADLDSLRFDALVATAGAQAAAGEEVKAAATIREALELWQGPALANVRSDLVQRKATVLNERRLEALEERIRLDLVIGRRELCAELRELVHANPYRERLYRYLMLALYRAGRQSEALDTYRDARAKLVDEIGIEPGPEMRKLEQAILRRDPTLDPKPRRHMVDNEPGVDAQTVPPNQLPATVADFTDRCEFVAEIKEFVRAPSVDDGLRIVAVSGKAGVGKSTLAIRVAHELGECFPDGHLYVDMQVDNADDNASKHLARMLRALGVSGTSIPDSLEERIGLYRSIIASRRMLVLVDNATDESQVQAMLPGSPACAVIVTSRKRLSVLPGALRIDVDVFDTGQSTELLRRILGEARVDAEPSATAELAAICAGSPLALRIAGARLASKPHWRISRLVRRLSEETMRLDELTHKSLELRSSIEVTYRALDTRAQQLLRYLALIDSGEFPGWVPAALLDIGELDAEDALEALVDARLLDVVEYPGVPRVRYRLHDLIRVYAHGRLIETDPPATRQAALDRMLGGWLALAEHAHRLEYGGDYTTVHSDCPRWQPSWLPATFPHHPMGCWEDERQGLVGAVRQAALTGNVEVCWDLALTIVTLFASKGYYDDWLDTSQLALDVAERAGSRRGCAAMQYSLGTLALHQVRLDRAERHLASARELFESEADVHGQALVMRHQGTLRLLKEDLRGAVGLYETAVEQLRSVGDRMGEAQVLVNLARIEIAEDNQARAADLLQEALALCQAVRCRSGEARVRYHLSRVYLHDRSFGVAEAELDRAKQIVRQSGDRVGECHVQYGLGVIREQEGRLEQAESVLDEALRLAKEVGEQTVVGPSLLALGRIALAAGHTSVGRARLARAKEQLAELGYPVSQARALLLLGENDLANGNVPAARRALCEADEMLVGLESQDAQRCRANVKAVQATLGAAAEDAPNVPNQLT